MYVAYQHCTQARHILHPGLSKSIFNGSETVFEIIEAQGDKTGWMILEDDQILKLEYIEGQVTSTRTEFNVEVGIDAILHVPESITVDGTTLLVAGRCTFRHLTAENGGVISMLTTSRTCLYVQVGLKKYLSFIKQK